LSVNCRLRQVFPTPAAIVTVGRNANMRWALFVGWSYRRRGVEATDSRLGKREDRRRRSTSVADDSVLEEVNVRHVRSRIRGKQPRSSLWIREPRSRELELIRFFGVGGLGYMGDLISTPRYSGPKCPCPYNVLLSRP
jgi:hypothetical protein